ERGYGAGTRRLLGRMVRTLQDGCSRRCQSSRKSCRESARAQGRHGARAGARVEVQRAQHSQLRRVPRRETAMAAARRSEPATAGAGCAQRGVTPAKDRRRRIAPARPTTCDSPVTGAAARSQQSWGRGSRDVTTSRTSRMTCTSTASGNRHRNSGKTRMLNGVFSATRAFPLASHEGLRNESTRSAKMALKRSASIPYALSSRGCVGEKDLLGITSSGPVVGSGLGEQQSQVRANANRKGKGGHAQSTQSRLAVHPRSGGWLDAATARPRLYLYHNAG